MKKITIGISIAAVIIVIIIVSLSMGNSGVSNTPNPSPTTIQPPTNGPLPTTNSPRHFDLTLDEKMKFRT
jgi:hypothetical protein